MNKCISISEFCKLVNKLEISEERNQCVKFKNHEIELRANRCAESFIEISLNQEGCLDYSLYINIYKKIITSHVDRLMYKIEGKKELCSGYTTINKYGTFLMELVDTLNVNFNVTSCTLEDNSTIPKGVYEGISLSMLYYLEHGKSWYNSLGYVYKNQDKLVKKIDGLLKQPILTWTEYVKNRNYGGGYFKVLLDSNKYPYVTWLYNKNDTSKSDDVSDEEKIYLDLKKSKKSFEQAIRDAIEKEDIKTMHFLNKFWIEVFMLDSFSDYREWTKKLEPPESKCVSISKFCKLTNELKEDETIIMCVKFESSELELHAMLNQARIIISLNQKGCLEYVLFKNTKQRPTSHVDKLMYNIQGNKESCSGYTINKYGTFLMRLVDAFNDNFHVKSCSIQDDATIPEGKYKGVCLSMLYYLKHGKSWYNSLGYYYVTQKKFIEKINDYLQKNISEWAEYIENRNSGGWFDHASGYGWLIDEEYDEDSPSYDEEVEGKYNDLENSGQSFETAIRAAIEKDDIKTIQIMNAFWKEIFLIKRDKKLRTWTKYTRILESPW